MLLMGQFMDGQGAHESGDASVGDTGDYTYFAKGPDATVGTRDDLLGRFSIRRYNWEAWSRELFGDVRDWQSPQTQDSVVLHQLEQFFTKYRLQFPDESLTQIYQRLACLWKAPTSANDVNPRTSWGSGLKTYIRKAGEAINLLGFEGWTTGMGWL
jgi:hypothetical protein